MKEVTLTDEEVEMIDIWADNSIEMFKDSKELSEGDREELQLAISIMATMRDTLPEAIKSMKRVTSCSTTMRRK